MGLVMKVSLIIDTGHRARRWRQCDVSGYHEADMAHTAGKTRALYCRFGSLLLETT